MTYIFVGSRAELVDPPLLLGAFGQCVDLEPVQATALILHQNFPLLPVDRFAKTEGETDRPLAARIALHEYREELLKPQRAEPAEEPIIHERI